MSDLGTNAHCVSRIVVLAANVLASHALYLSRTAISYPCYSIYSRNSLHRVIHAWDMVDQRVIVTSFLKTGISSALDGSEDGALWQTEENVDEESESEEDYSSEEESNDA